MSNTWVPNDGAKNETEFDLFAPNTEDNLHEVLAKGSYKWTNKYTAVFAIALVVVTSASAGIWYGHRSASSNAISGLAGASGFSRGGFNRGSFGGGATSSASAASGAPGGLAAAGAAAGFAGGGFGGSRVSGTITSVKGKTITVTADTDPSSTLKKGDTVSVRVAGGGGGFTPPSGAPAPGGATNP